MMNRRLKRYCPIQYCGIGTVFMYFSFSNRKVTYPMKNLELSCLRSQEKMKFHTNF